MEQKLTVTLTDAEKRTVLIGEHFCGLQFANVGLAGAVFREAELAGARFVQADLHGADFRHANLHGAEFLLCNLYGVDLTDACVEQATFRAPGGVV
ncbi:MAG TPA: pentapeptide repeat-containing protein [Methylomirabilota bacterium]|jgi:uncharacterized protein YjbI with pentapeptide repeats|nr:pentapeptide repeat-containing protein [Methylomirabilota bacterium]